MWSKFFFSLIARATGLYGLYFNVRQSLGRCSITPCEFFNISIFVYGPATTQT